MAWRRIRAAVTMGFLWSAGAFATGVMVARIPGLRADVPFAILFAPLGFAGGVAFSTMLVMLSRRSRLSRLSLPRFAAVGGASGFLLGSALVTGSMIRGELLTSGALLFVVGLSAASAIGATASLAIARRASAPLTEDDPLRHNKIRDPAQPRDHLVRIAERDAGDQAER